MDSEVLEDSLLANLLKGILLLGRKLVSFSLQKTEELLPRLKCLVNDGIEKSKTDLLPHAKKGVDFVVNNAKEHVLPYVNKAAEYAGKTLKEDLLPRAKENLNIVVDNTKEHVLPFVKAAAEYAMETVKEHPWVSGFVVLLVLLYYLSKPGSSGKMMKAPGRGYIMARSTFEGNPKGYFRSLRGKGK